MKRYIKSSSSWGGKYGNELDSLADKLVPPNGKADTVAGEIVRATERIGYRWYNDGDQVGVGYGKETCNPAARYLIAKCGPTVLDIIDNMDGETYSPVEDSFYTRLIERLTERIVKYIKKNPELMEEQNTENYLDYKNRNEDIDDTDWEDDDYYEHYGEIGSRKFYDTI